MALQYIITAIIQFHITRKNHFLYPHLRSFMRFSDTIQRQIPQPTKYANSDSSPFNSDESLSDDDSQTFMTPSSTENFSQKTITSSTTLTPSNTSNQNLSQESTPYVPSNHKSLTPHTNDSTLYKNIINTLTLISPLTDQDLLLKTNRFTSSFK